MCATVEYGGYLCIPFLVIGRHTLAGPEVGSIIHVPQVHSGDTKRKADSKLRFLTSCSSYAC